jgi:hypothetical protein
MKKLIESKTTLIGLLDEIISNVIVMSITIIALNIAITKPEWFTSEDYYSLWKDFGPFVKWSLIVGCSIALICLLRDFLEIVLYGQTKSLSINLNEGALTLTTSHKSFFKFSYEKSTIAHKLLSVNVTQGYFGKLYDTGTLTIKVSAYNNTEANEHEFTIEGISNPFGMKNEVQENIPVANDKLNIKS